MVFWDVAPCSPVESYHCFRGTCCLHLQGMRWRQHFPPKCWCLSIRLHGVTSQKTIIFTWECYLYNLSHSSWFPWWFVLCYIVSQSVFWSSIAQVNTIFVLLIVVQFSLIVLSIVRHTFSVWYNLLVVIPFISYFIKLWTEYFCECYLQDTLEQWMLIFQHLNRSLAEQNNM
jgi:hypothetical protein